MDRSTLAWPEFRWQQLPEKRGAHGNARIARFVARVVHLLLWLFFKAGMADIRNSTHDDPPACLLRIAGDAASIVPQNPLSFARKSVPEVSITSFSANAKPDISDPLQERFEASTNPSTASVSDSGLGTSKNTAPSPHLDKTGHSARHLSLFSGIDSNGPHHSSVAVLHDVTVERKRSYDSRIPEIHT